MRTARGAALLALAGALALGRARSALRRRFGAGGLLSGALFQAATSGLVVLAGLFYAWVAASLIGTLAARGNAAATAAAAGAHLDLVLILVLVTTLLTDGESTGLDARPLAPLALGAHERLVAGLLAELFLSPGAVIIWPSALALLLGVAQAGPGVALFALPSSVGLVLLAVGAAMLVRGLAGAVPGHRPGSSVVVIVLRMALVLLPLAWALGALRGLEGAGAASPLRPGFWVESALRAAMAGDPRALAWGSGPILVGLGLLVTAAQLVAPSPSDRAFAPATPGRARSSVDAEGLRLWRLPRVRLVTSQALTAGLALVVLSGALAARGVGGEPLAALGALLVAWIVASGPSPIAANVLGAGGAAGAYALAAARRPELWMLRSAAWVVGPSALAAGCAAFAAAWILGATRAGWIGAALALALALASLGAGCLASVAWPWRTGLVDPGDPAWPPGPGRWMLPLAHAFPLAIAASCVVGGRRFGLALSCGMIVLGGTLVGAAAFVVARRLLLGRRAAVTEGLLG